MKSLSERLLSEGRRDSLKFSSMVAAENSIVSPARVSDSTTFADPVEAEKRARAIVKAATHFNDPQVLLEVSEDLVGAMKGLAVSGLDEAHMLQTRGW